MSCLFTPCRADFRVKVAMSSTRERSNALALLLLCGELRNGGRIVGCAEWTDAQWIATCGINMPQNCALYHWEGKDLVLDLYSTEAPSKKPRRTRRTRATEADIDAAFAPAPEEP